jgi:adenine phosphoribosyltransferase
MVSAYCYLPINNLCKKNEGKGMNGIELKKLIRNIPDFPKPGVIFRDLTTLWKDAKVHKYIIDEIVKRYEGKGIDVVASVEARGFIVGSPVAYKLGAGFIPLRKPGKLPYKTVRQEYELEYGTEAIEIHEDAIKPNQKVLIVDDLLATGGTALAAAKLIERLGGNVEAIVFIVELAYLNGREKLKDYKVETLTVYEE